MQGRGKEKVIPQERRDFRSDRYINSRPRRDFTRQPETTSARNVGVVFRDPVHQVLEKIKNEPYFRWPNKMAGGVHKAKPKPVLPISPGSRTHQGKL